VLGEALLSSDLVGRNLAIGNMLARLSPENVGEALRVFENTPSSFHTDNNFRLFLHAWAKLDGKAALSYILGNPDARKVDGQQAWAMSGWTASDPAAAMAFIEQLELENEGKVDRGLHHGLVRGLGRHDLESASDYVRDMENHETRHWMTDVLIESSLEQRGPEATMAWASQLVATAGEDDKPGWKDSRFDRFGFRRGRRVDDEQPRQRTDQAMDVPAYRARTWQGRYPRGRAMGGGQ